MKPSLLTLLLLAFFAWAQEEEAEEGENGGEAEAPATPAAAPDPAKVLTDLAVANESKDPLRIDGLLSTVSDAGKTSKDQKALDAIAVELSKSYKICKGNHGTMVKLLEAMGELRSKKGASLLKKLATQRKVEEGEEEELQAVALQSLARMRDRRYISTIAEECKNSSVVVAKGAYAALGLYGPEKAKVRKDIAEILMKRIDMEYPSSGGQRSTNVSAEKQERWNQLSPAIVSSLQAICRQNTINDIDNWREWWRENKKNAKAWRDED